MAWRKGESLQLPRCERCKRREDVAFCKTLDQYLCEECFTEACLDKDQEEMPL